MASEGDAQYEASDESSENELLDKSLSVWKGLGWNVKETFEPIPLDLHTASSIGHFDCVRNFISRKVDLNKKNRGGWTPLMYAAYIGHDNIVNLLLDAGVNVNIKNHKGQTPLMLASTCGNESVSYFICQQGAELEARDNKGWTALFHSTYAGHQNMVRFLLEQGANINSVEPSKGMTPFMEAAAEGHEIIVQIFLQHGVNVNTKAHNGDTARSLALIHGHMKVVSLIDNHILPITCLRSEAGLDANLSSSDESFPVKRPTSARDKRGKGKGPSIRDGPDAIAKLIDRSSIPKGYVSVQQGETTQDGGQKISYREVTSPINPQDFSLESSKDSCDIDQDEDGNAFSQTGALTIKSSSGSSGGLAAAFGINREGSVDSDDYHPQDSLTSNTSQSDCHSSLGGSRNSLNNSPEPYEGGCGKSNNDMNIVAGADGYGSVEGGQRKGLRKESTEPELRQMKGSKQGRQLTKGGISNSLGRVAPPPGFQPLPQVPLPVQIGDMESSIIDQRKINEAFEITDTGEDNSAPFPERNTGRSSVVRGENLHQAAESRSSVKETGQPNAKAKHPSVDFMIGNTPIKESRSQEFPESSGRGRPQEGDKPRYPPQSVPGATKHGQQQQQQHQQKRQQSQQQHLSQHPHPHLQHNPQLHHHHQSQSMETLEVHSQYQDSNFPVRQSQSVSNAVATPGHHTNSSVPVMSPMGSGTVPQTNVAVCPPIGYQLFPNGATLNPNMVNNATTKGGNKPPIPSQHMPKTVNQSCVNPSAHSAMKPQGNQHGGHMTGQGGSHSGHPGKAAPPGGVGQMPGQQTTASSVPSLNMLQDQGFFRAQKSVTNGYPDSLHELLDQLGLLKYLAVFEEQDVDLQVFLSLTDADLKEVGIKLFGPRKKMINAISRWHNQGPSVVEGNVEQAYANRMQLEMQEVSVQLQKAFREVEKLKAQVLQEQRIRTVTENCLTDIQRVSYDTKQKCEEMKESLKKLKYYHSEVRGKMAPNRKRQPASSSETQLLSDLTHAIKEDLSMEDSGAGQDNLSASANLIIRKIEHHLLDLSHSIKMITINADKLLSWGVNSQHETSYS